MTNEELAEIRAYVAERQAARARGEHIDSDERREAALLAALDEAREEAAQWKRLAEQTTDARLAEAIASREVMQRERDEARARAEAAEKRGPAVVTLGRLDRVLTEYPDADVATAAAEHERSVRADERAKALREAAETWRTSTRVYKGRNDHVQKWLRALADKAEVGATHEGDAPPSWCPFRGGER